MSAPLRHGPDCAEALELSVRCDGNTGKGAALRVAAQILKHRTEKHGPAAQRFSDKSDAETKSWSGASDSY
jgi:hypothetical protein